MLNFLFRRRGFITFAVILSLTLTGDVMSAGNEKGNGGKPPNEDPPAVELPTYSITFLGTLGGSRSYPNGISAAGEIFGASWALIPGGSVVAPSGALVSEVEHGFLNVDDGNGGRTMIDLHDKFVEEGLIPPFDWDNFKGLIVHEAHDMNDNGQIVGHVDELDGGYLGFYSFRYTPASTDENGNFVPAKLDHLRSLQEPAINNNGVVVGTDYDVFPDAAVIWDENNGVTIIGDVFDVENYGLDINDNLQIIGRTNNLNTKGWRYSASEGFVDIPLLTNRSSSNTPHAMNELGEVACTDIDGRKGHRRASLFSDATGSVDLGTLGGNSSQGGGINNFAHVVGESQLSDGSWRLFLYTPETGIFNLEAQTPDLPAEHVGQLYRWDWLHINDAGQISGFSHQTSEAYLLTPQ